MGCYRMLLILDDDGATVVQNFVRKKVLRDQQLSEKEVSEANQSTPNLFSQTKYLSGHLQVQLNPES